MKKLAVAVSAAFALAVHAGTPAGAPVSITNIAVDASNVHLTWEAPLGKSANDLKLYESTNLLDNTWTEVTNNITKSVGDATVASDVPVKFFRLYAAAPDNNGGYDFTYWFAIDHTIMIDLDTWDVTRLARDYNVTNDLLSTTTHLYMRHVTNNVSGKIGSASDEFGHSSNETLVNPKTLNNGYYIGVYPVTRGQWAKVMGTAAPSTANEAKPQVGNGTSTGLDAMCYAGIRSLNRSNGSNVTYTVGADVGGSFMERLNYHVRLNNPDLNIGGNTIGFDLPTEAQWEIACRAGTTGSYNDNNDVVLTTDGTNTELIAALEARLRLLGWFSGNNTTEGFASGTKPVGLKIPNLAGMYDFHGNVYEWCLDAYNATNTSGDGPMTADTASAFRPVRGGDYGSTASSCRSAYRSYNNAGYSFGNIGFRLRASGAVVSE